MFAIFFLSKRNSKAHFSKTKFSTKYFLEKNGQAQKKLNRGKEGGGVCDTGFVMRVSFKFFNISIMIL